jgi:hypothetical protein
VRTDVGAGGATDSLVQSARWVELGCSDDRLGLPLTIGSPELPLYDLIELYSKTTTSWRMARQEGAAAHRCAVFCMQSRSLARQ